MKTIASELKKDVEAELKWEPGLDESRIGIFVENGVVALSGHVRNFVERQLAEQTVKRVRGVTAVANELQIDLIDAAVRDDVKIAKAAQEALLWNVRVPEQALKVTVSKGWLTLEGTVPFQFQRAAAEDAVAHLTGLVGLTNRIVVRPLVSAVDVKRKLTAALHRYASLDAARIEVDADGGSIVLRGTVPSWNERDRVQNAAWAVPGVTAVDNMLTISD